MKEVLYEIKGLKKYFPVRGGAAGEAVRAVDGIDLTIYSGETLGIVGESGCGKSTFGRTLVKLLECTEGQLIFQGKDITHFPAKEMRALRKDIQMMFQDPYASLNPRWTVANIIAEPLDTMKLCSSKEERLRRVVDLMETCGINKAFLNRYPHEFSGGQRQRIGIARALSVNPKMVICDEPVSALDVSIQSQIINLMIELQKKYKLTLVFISHDLGVVEYISDRVAVMYLGKIVELAETRALFDCPMHPYTRALLDSIPHIGGDNLNSEDASLEADVPSPVNPPGGCRFHTRCKYARSVCSTVEPALQDMNGRCVACHFPLGKE